MRVTRARAQQPVEEPTVTEQERAPLNEISPNASPEQVLPVEDIVKKTPARSKSKKGAKKGAKGKKNKVVEDEPVQLESGVEQEVAAAVPVIDAQEELAKDEPSETPSVPSHEERPASPVPKATRLTRRQLAKQEEELQQAQRVQSESEETSVAPKELAETTTVHEKEQPDVESESLEVHPEAVSEAAVETQESGQHIEAPHVQEEPEIVAADEVTASEALAIEVEHEIFPTIEPVVNATDNVAISVEHTPRPEPKSLAAERPIEDALSPASSRTPSRRRASRSPSKSPMRIEESIEALDALEEALEDVGKAVSHFDKSREQRSPRKKAFPRTVSTPNTRSKEAGTTPLAQRISKAPSAAPSSIKPTKSSLARTASVRAEASKDVARKGSADTSDYLASKRRPINLSFPTPPPPPKGRAPTRPAFQLSSETVAAKLKAQKEERLKREAEREAQGSVAAKQRPVSVSLAPTVKSSKPPTKATFELPGSAVAAKLKARREERLQRQAEGPADGQVKSKARPISMPPPATVKSSKPPTVANFQLPGEAIAAKLKAQREERQKREEEAESAKRVAAATSRPLTLAHRKSVILPSRNASGMTIPPPPKTDSSISSTASKRNSIQLSRSTSMSTLASSNRNSALITKSIVTPVDAAQQKAKGREMFFRDKMEGNKERERREKEDAAKKARADAAERGRAASREWAERQRQKMMQAVKEKANAT